MHSAKRKSYCIALSGILSAICIVLMFCTGLIPLGVYLFPALAGLVVWLIYAEINRKWALLCYGCVAILSFLLTPDIEAKLIFTGFFGYYPIIRDLLKKIKPGILSFIVRFTVFNVPVIIIYFLLINLLGMGQIIEDFSEFGDFALLVFWAFGSFAFICYDFCLEQLLYVYDKWLKKIIQKITRYK